MTCYSYYLYTCASSVIFAFTSTLCAPLFIICGDTRQTNAGSETLHSIIFQVLSTSIHTKSNLTKTPGRATSIIGSQHCQTSKTASHANTTLKNRDEHMLNNKRDTQHSFARCAKQDLYTNMHTPYKRNKKGHTLTHTSSSICILVLRTRHADSV